MKITTKISFLLLILAIGFTSCKKCSNCQAEAGKNYRWETGDVLTVSSGIITYMDIEYTKGESFTIDSTATQFEGNGKVFIYSEFCGNGRTYDNMMFEHERNGWVCDEVKKKDVAEENR